jgi:hypothetical protein
MLPILKFSETSFVRAEPVASTLLFPELVATGFRLMGPDRGLQTCQDIHPNCDFTIQSGRSEGTRKSPPLAVKRKQRLSKIALRVIVVPGSRIASLSSIGCKFWLK